MELDRKSTRLNSSHTEIYTPFPTRRSSDLRVDQRACLLVSRVHRSLALRLLFNIVHIHLGLHGTRSEEHTSELQSHRDLHSFPYTTLFRSKSRSASLLACLSCAPISSATSPFQHSTYTSWVTWN